MAWQSSSHNPGGRIQPSAERLRMKICVHWIAVQRFCSAPASHSFCFPEVNTVDMCPPIWLVWMMAFFDIPLYLVTAERFILNAYKAKRIAS